MQEGSGDEWWSSVREALDVLSPSEATIYQRDALAKDSTAADGLHESWGLLAIG